MAEISSARVALVTGAARGIGAASARRLASAGYRVVAMDWCTGATSEAPYPQAARADLEAVAKPFEDRVIPYIGDVRDSDAVIDAVSQATTRWGRLDVAVAAAAVIAGGRPQWVTPAEHLDAQWSINAKGMWNTAAAAIPVMLAGPDPRGCRFVGIASVAATSGLFHLSAYNMSKHAVAGLIRGLAADLAGTGVTATAVSPGSTDTVMLKATADLYNVSTDDLIQHQGLRRVLDPDEIAAVVAFCCSREAAALNGSIVNADGGFGL